ncbi:oxygenase MpaB family protein [Rhodococcus sp. NPDC058514]|uniref:oxygenase MpaB family protein n=1 Tax=unclassified Rhodococcus (in: high G+C Gram-positive bacteria) TaxID=192944 RepID=UPI0036584DAF
MTSQVGSTEESREVSSVKDKCPTAFRYWDSLNSPRTRRMQKLSLRLTGGELFPTDEQVTAFCNDLYAGDPVAERFIDEVFEGDIGPVAGRAMLDQALTEGVHAVADVPPAMAELFAEFEDVPDWVRPELVEQGAAIWRRWGTMLFTVAGSTTLEMYTEAAVATPLSLSGGYAGDNALRRFLETSRFWMDLSEPHALLTPGSKGRATAMRVRVMHVSVRRRVAEHPEWHSERWGLPISQGYMMLTLIGGSVAPAMALWTLGYQTTPKEMRALLHFQRYMGHLLGVRVGWYPENVRDTLRALAMVIASRSYDSGRHGAELIESFPASFAPRDGHRGLQRLRERYNYRIYSAYAAIFMGPKTRRKYNLPRAFPWVLIPVLRFPLVTVMELARRFVPGVAGPLERIALWHRENWYRAQMDGREAEFQAKGALRR